jgi:hypothetical protein
MDVDANSAENNSDQYRKTSKSCFRTDGFLALVIWVVNLRHLVAKDFLQDGVQFTGICFEYNFVFLVG